jgi:hypothetical protein
MVTQKQALKATRSAGKRRKQYKALLKEKNIGYVVRSSRLKHYSTKLERTSDLTPFASADLQNFKESESSQTRWASRL